MKISFFIIISSLVLTSSLFTFNDSFAAGFIKFDGVDGESTDKDHKGWIDLLSFSQVSVANDSTNRSNETTEIVVEKEVDKSSPKILESIVKGKVIPKVEIHFTEDDGTYNSYELTNVLITSYSFSGDSDSRPTEEIHLYYEKINQKTQQTKEPETAPVEPTPPQRPTEVPATEIVKQKVPSWVQTTATFWVDGNVSDREFTDGIGYLVREKIIDLEPIAGQADGQPSEPGVPSWIKQNTRWWIEGQVPENQFLDSIKWLIQNNIITGVSN